MELRVEIEKVARVALASLLAVLIAQPASAYEAMAGARFVDLDFRGDRGQVQEYNGKYYGNKVHGDASVSNEGADGLLDLSMWDIGSTEENAYVNLDFKDSVRVSGKWENMHHRLNYIRTGMIMSGTFLTNPAIIFRSFENQELVMRRTESEFSFLGQNAEDSALWFFAQYWRSDKVGSTIGQFASYLVDRANVDNTKQDVTIGVGAPMGERSAMGLELVHSEFKDSAVAVDARAANLGYTVKPRYNPSEMNGAEFKFRHDPSQALAVTGAFTGRERASLYNGFKNRIAVGALNAAYRVNQKLSLVARMYFRGNQMDENTQYRENGGSAPYTGWPAGLPYDQRDQMDKQTYRAELSATYRPTHAVTVKGDYKLEHNQRHHLGEVENLSGTTAGAGYWYDGYFLPLGAFKNEVALSETRHTVKLGAKAELPLGMELEAAVKRLQANASAFVNQPNVQNEADASLSVPLPAHVELSLMSNYVRERNTKHVPDRNYHSTRHVHRAGLDWAAFDRVFVGVDGSYEHIKYIADVSFGSPSTLATANKTYREPGMTNRQENTTAGGHARVNLPKGFVVTGNGSYTWSKVSARMHYVNSSAAPFTVDDYAPTEVRIARGTVGLEYTPERYKNLTARVSYRVDDWVDRLDAGNSGRASIAQAGVSAKF